jgi:hypothetical protein
MLYLPDITLKFHNITMFVTVDLQMYPTQKCFVLFKSSLISVHSFITTENWTQVDIVFLTCSDVRNKSLQYWHKVTKHSLLWTRMSLTFYGRFKWPWISDIHSLVNIANQTYVYITFLTANHLKNKSQSIGIKSLDILYISVANSSLVITVKLEAEENLHRTAKLFSTRKKKFWVIYYCTTFKDSIKVVPVLFLLHKLHNHQGGLQWHNIHTRFYENLSSGSWIERDNITHTCIYFTNVMQIIHSNWK